MAPTPLDSMLVCLPYWDGDWEQMREVAALLADLLREKQDRLELMFVLRNDARATPDSKVMEKCHGKFRDVHIYRNKRRGVGWPMGCNEMAFGIFDHVCNYHAKFQRVDCVLLVEADCVMLRRSWGIELLDEWKKTREAGKLICGTVIPHGFRKAKAHVNAVAMYSWDIAQKLPCLRGSPGTVGWDFFHGDSTCAVAVDTPLIYMDYSRETITEKVLFSKKAPVLYHGVKDDSARRAVRSKLKL